MEDDKNVRLILDEFKKLRTDNKAEFEKNRLEAKSEAGIISKKIESIITSIKDTNIKMDKVCKKINEHETRIGKLEDKVVDIDGLKYESNMLSEQVTNRLAEKDKEIIALKNQMDTIEVDRRRSHITISGIPEVVGEDKSKLATLVQNMLKKTLGIEENVFPYQVYRRGENRRIIYKIVDPGLKTLILKNAYKLKGSNIFISHDFTIRQETARYYLRQFIRNKGHDKAKFVSHFTVEYEGLKYSYNESKNLVQTVTQSFDPNIV